MSSNVSTKSGGGRFWTNPSVLALAGDGDPVDAITGLAQHVVLAAVDAGWEGPPFDPFVLADLLGVPLVAGQGLLDARTVPSSEQGLPRHDPLDELLGPTPPVLIEYNPARPRGRLRYSLAHELAHTLFPDVAAMVRNRTGTGAVADLAGSDEWQLELLCNIAAGELLMPTDTLAGLDDSDLDIDALMAVRAHYDVSTEALLRRVAAQTRQPVAVFAASRVRADDASSPFQVEYAVGSRSFASPLRRGQPLPAAGVLADCAAIGFTARGTLAIAPAGIELAVQCVGLSPYPGQRLPRVAGFVRSAQAQPTASPSISYVAGDATTPRGSGPRLIAHVVNNQASRWAPHSLAGQLAQTYPHAAFLFSTWVLDDPTRLHLGNVHFADVPGQDLTVASMVAQHGYGPSAEMRLSYEALGSCLRTVAEQAARLGASVHLPRIGTGQAGGRWPVVRELIDRTLCRHHIPVTVYTLPGQRLEENGEGITLRSLRPGGTDAPGGSVLATRRGTAPPPPPSLITGRRRSRSS
jgi:hypothetical protein